MAKLTQQELIIALRKDGLSYEEISSLAGCTPEYARNIWSRAYSKETAQPKSGFCKFCGKKLEDKNVTKPRLFCDDHCCNAYYAQGKKRKVYRLICERCGLEFLSIGVPKRRFCSRECQTLAALEKKHRDAG